MWQNASVTNILAVQGTRNTFFHLAYPFVSQLLKDVLQQTESNMMMKCAVPATQCVYVLCVCVVFTGLDGLKGNSSGSDRRPAETRRQCWVEIALSAFI